MNRQEKREFVSDFSHLVEDHLCMFVVRHTLDARMTHELRKQVRQANATLRVVKNSLARIALDKAPETLKASFTGPIGVLFSQNPVEAAKIIKDFAKKREERFEIIVGFLEGQVMNKDQVIQLADMPPLEQMRAKLLGTMQAPASQLAGLLREVLARLVRVLDGKKETQK